MKLFLQSCLALSLALAAQLSVAAPFEAGLKAMDREHYATAYRAWKQLADDGAAEAQNNIGYLYEQGRGVKQSYARAIEWYNKGIEGPWKGAAGNCRLRAEECVDPFNFFRRFS